jgi:hypothetical protein
MRMSKFAVQRMTFVLAILGLTVILGGCTQLSSLPDEERYQYINQTKNKIDYASAGEVIDEGYDNGDGVFESSGFYAKVEGTDSFESLTNQVKMLPDVTCQTFVDSQTRCRLDRVSIEINKNPSGITDLYLIDSSNGRD